MSRKRSRGLVRDSAADTANDPFAAKAQPTPRSKVL